MNIKQSIVLRTRIAFLFVLLFGVAILFKIFTIQVVNGEEWRAKAEQISLKYRNVKALRGNIYDVNGNLLATSLPFFRMGFDPSVASDEVYNSVAVDSLAYLLAEFLGEHDKAYYKTKLKDSRESGKRYLRLTKKQINYHQKKEMSEWPIFREGRYKGGVIFEKINKRFKPFKDLASRTIGRVWEDTSGNVAGNGLEYSFNTQLGGQQGKALYQKMSGGLWKPVFDGNEIEATNGWDIQTTIDINIQDVAEDALLKACSKYEAEYGCVVVMEVATGEIKAVANIGRTEKGTYYEDYNYAVAGATEPGSTFKLASMIALMEYKNLKLTDTINAGDGRFKFYDRTMTDAKFGGYGNLTVQEVFEKSSNIGTSRLVEKYFHSNPQKYLDYLKHIGIDRPVDFQIMGEAEPYIKKTTDKSWSGVSLPWMSIGYELKLAPIHTLTLYNAIANGGKMISPILIKESRIGGKPVEHYHSHMLNDQICSTPTLRKVRKMLEGVVERGTAKNIKTDKYKIAGKTGTAQKIEKGRYVRKYYTSFAGYFPADNPKYSCIVIVDSPKGYYMEGSTTAAPVFREIADKIYSTDFVLHKPLEMKNTAKKGHFPMIKGGYREDLKFLCNKLAISNHTKTEEDWVQSSVSNNSVYWKSKGMIENLVPNVLGYTLKDAVYVLENQGLEVKFEGVGRVVKQSQQSGTKALRGSVVVLILE